MSQSFDIARSHLAEMGVTFDALAPIREKDGVGLVRVHTDGGTAILKHFEKPAYRREIANYRILAELGVPTMAVHASSDRALLLEDIDAGEEWRLGVPDDLGDQEIASLIAAWYRTLHSAGRDYAATSGVGLYDETDVLTEPNLRAIAGATETAHLPVWALIFENLAEIERRLSRLPRTLTYNDFYWTNLVVAKDRSAAFMFDYNLLGKGYVYGDVRNVCSSLSVEAAEAFRAAYGEVSETEILADDVASTLVTLHFACEQPSFPSWADDERRTLQDGLLKGVEALLNAE